MIQKAISYEQYEAATFFLDRSFESDEFDANIRYDHNLIQNRRERMKYLDAKDDIKGLIFEMRGFMERNPGGIGNADLYEHPQALAKELIESYTADVIHQLKRIAEEDMGAHDIVEKTRILKAFQSNIGRTALLLSGGGTLGLSHIGVLKVLWEQKLLPKVITGSSAGSIVAGIFCTKSDKELQEIIDLSPTGPNVIDLNFFDRKNTPFELFKSLEHFWEKGVFRDVNVFNECMAKNIGDITFQEAYFKTRRILNITVSSSSSFEMPRILNYLTAPNVLIRSAVVASSSIPFIYKATPLMAKDASKKIIQWNSHLAPHCIDGSLEGDLPMQRISELFGINHYVVAQTNPHIIPFMTKANSKSRFQRGLAIIGSEIRAELCHRLKQTFSLEYKFVFRFYSLISQRYSGDITITPSYPLKMFLKVISNPTHEMAKSYTIAGERATWPIVAILRNRCLIELALTEVLADLNQRSVLGYDPDPDPDPQKVAAVIATESPYNPILPALFNRNIKQAMHKSVSSGVEELDSKQYDLIATQNSLRKSHRSTGDMRNQVFVNQSRPLLHPLTPMSEEALGECCETQPNVNCA